MMLLIVASLVNVVVNKEQFAIGNAFVVCVGRSFPRVATVATSSNRPNALLILLEPS